MLKHSSNDIDPIETQDWLQSISSVIQREGVERAQFLINQIIHKARHDGVIISENEVTNNYINTISVKDEPEYPGNLEIEKHICAVIRWNAIMIVLNASKKNLELGGHIASFQSAATLYEVCFNHFFRGSNSQDEGDLIYFQGHISPGIYARAFLEGRLHENQLNNFRQESKNLGLPAYPHPRLMPEFWQFPTVSMGLAPISAIYQAKFLKYLKNRNLKDTTLQTVYAFLGDGEMDEPESKGALNVAAREKLDNLIFIINCNLQRLDGPVMGNGKIIHDLESIFKGSGWEVIKVIWGSKWDALLHKDTSGKLVQLMNETVDGDYQTFRSKDGAYIRKHFFGKYPETKSLVENMSDSEIWELDRGGHDPKKMFAALEKAKHSSGKPVVILAHTVKGYGMGSNMEGMNIAHQIKKIDTQEIRYIRDKFGLNLIKDNQIESLPYLTFKEDSKEYIYLHERRKTLFGYVPSRLRHSTYSLELPTLDYFYPLLIQQNRDISTTLAFVRILNILLKYIPIKNRLVPIVADEARTFGMEGLFRQIGIYNSMGQQYTPQDYDLLAYYREDKQGQILQEGINELGAAASWLAAATSYSTNNFPMVPFYIYYSIFGFQRIGDLFWAAADQQARGFLVGATSGRTTLNGEGLQHADGHSHIQSLTIPNCISYDPTYAYEIAVIIQDGLIRMYGNSPENIYYYITTLNEKYHMPTMPIGVEEGIKKGIYKLESLSGSETNGKIQLMGSGAILRIVRKAGQILSKEYDVASDIYSVTSFTELARDGQDCERWNMLHPTDPPKIPYVTTILNDLPTIAATDYMKLFAEQIRCFVPNNHFFVLGTDGFGRSDSRENLRHYFEVNAGYIVTAALTLLLKQGHIKAHIFMKAIKKFDINPEKINPRLV